jgi:hypothetical protein
LKKKEFNISVKTINGQVLQDPVTMNFPCNVVPVGESIVRYLDINFCIINKKVYLFRNGQDVFGTTIVNCLDGFNQYRGVNCGCCPELCLLEYNNCYLMYNDCTISYGVGV